MTTFIMLFSLVVGFVSIILPAYGLYGGETLLKRHGAKLLCLSLAGCILSLYAQFFYFRYLAKIQEVSSFLDTAGGVFFGATCLVLLVFVLNAMLIKKLQR